jgi:hypothetical protein
LVLAVVVDMVEKAPHQKMVVMVAMVVVTVEILHKIIHQMVLVLQVMVLVAVVMDIMLLEDVAPVEADIREL